MNLLLRGATFATLIFLSACFGGSSGGGSTSAPSNSVSGTAAKGIVINGLVQAYLIATNGIPETTPIATTTTDTEGKYSLSIPAQHQGKPLYVTIRNNSGAATMKCDLPNGCGAASFGGTYSLAGDFELSAVLPSASGSVTTNLTPLTTAAAKKAKTSMADSGSNFGAAAQIAQANSSVAATLSNIFGTTIPDITTLPVIDLTNSNKVSAAISNTVALQMAALNAGLISATQADNAGASIEQALTMFTNQLAAGPLTYDSSGSNPATTDVVDILNQTSQVVSSVVTKVTTDLQLSQTSPILLALSGTGGLASTINNARTAATGNSGSVNDTPSSDSSSPRLVKAKAFIDTLRNLGTVIDQSTPNGQSQTIEELMNNFDQQVQAAEMITSEDVEVAMWGFAEGAAAIAQVMAENFDPETGAPTEESGLTTFPAQVVAVENGLTVTITQTSSGYLFNVDSMVEIDEEGTQGTADINVSATISNWTVTLNETETENTSVGNANASGSLNLSGTSSTDLVDFEVLNGTVAINGMLTWDDSFESTSEAPFTASEESDTSLVLQSLSFDLDVEIAHGANIGAQPFPPMTFSGGLTFSVNALNYDSMESRDEQWSQTSYSENSQLTEVISFGLGSLGIDGFFGTANTNFEVSLLITVNATGVTPLTINESWSFGTGQPFMYNRSETGGETENNWVGVTIALDFETRMAGIAEVVKVNFDASRTGYDDMLSTLTLQYPGESLTFSADVRDMDTQSTTATLTLSNLAGAVINATITQNSDGSETVVATVSCEGEVQGQYVPGPVDRIVYIDGTYVSAF